MAARARKQEGGNIFVCEAKCRSYSVVLCIKKTKRGLGIRSAILAMVESLRSSACIPIPIKSIRDF